MFDELEGTLKKIDRNTQDTQDQHVKTRNKVQSVYDSLSWTAI